VAFAVGVSDRAIGRWERDETSPDARYLPKLAEVLKRTQQWVKHGDDNAELAPEYASKLKTVVAPFPPGVDKLLLRGVSLLELSRKHPEWRIPNARNST
jgi:transcriptional regulator with XRE-family HTH domain